MNKLMLIGNGFDIAHSLPTKYGQFLEDYLEEIAASCRANDLYLSHDLVIAHNSLPGAFQALDTTEIKKLINGELVNGFISTMGGRKFSNINFQVFNKIIKDSFPHYFKLNWVDIEQIFYDNLIQVAKTGDVQQVVALNADLERIKTKLISYLSKHTKFTEKPHIQDIFNKGFRTEHFKESAKYDLTICENVLVLNFNYTTTPNVYVDKASLPFKNTPVKEIINIHGKLHGYPVIFGFGDEMDQNFGVLEKLNKNGFLDNIKSSQYSIKNDYKKLINFLELGDFQVELLGHSCGLSDRVMLNMIFEHKNCTAIVPYYHNIQVGNHYLSKSYKDTVQNISRHFNDKAKMRERVVSYDLCEAMS